MRVIDYLTRSRTASEEEREVETGEDAPTTRRALLTGGAAVAGVAAASTLATVSKSSAATTYVQLGANNIESFATVITNQQGLIAFGGTANQPNGTGVLGTANNGTASNGVKGTSNQGTGVHGVSAGGTGVSGEGSGSSSYGVKGSGGYSGVYASGGSYGAIFYGNNSGAYGVYGNGNYLGVYGTGATYGVYGAGTSYGVYGGGTTGVQGSGSSYGVYGTASSGSGHAVHGQGGQYGVYGAGGGTAGVRGESGYVGVWAQAPVYGINALSTATSGQSFGVFTEAAAAGDAYALYAKGKAHVAGTLSKSAGSFKIDHPLDPERKWLQHSFVESPDMMNVYNGNVTTNADGVAVVKLPAYFGALNRDFRYQLTVIGKMAQAIVDQKVVNNQFRIRTDQGNVEVSWQVTGIRQDDYAKAHPIQVEVAKRQEDIGTREFLPPGKSGRLMSVGPQALK